CNQCPYMALNTLEKLYHCMNTLGPEIEVDEITRIKALAPLNKMLEMSPSMASNRPPASGRAF
ncbi:MAG: quinolinate synthase NadA, partial [Kordiimonadaceae bacterium]|nr:quinolinate synthase NadA [Kordiimonadaceae bacterium]